MNITDTSPEIHPVHKSVHLHHVTALKLRNALNESAGVDLNALLGMKQRVLDLHAIVTITDCDGRILYCNDKFTDISGYAALVQFNYLY